MVRIPGCCVTVGVVFFLGAGQILAQQPDTASEQPQVKVNGLNVCTPSSEEKNQIAAALAKIPQVNPDLVTLDVEMPEMDGLQTLAAIRKSYPTLPVIMFSTLTERGASSTLDALALGANDYVTKPANVGSVSIAQQRIREQLIPKIKMFCGRSAGIPVTPVLSKSAQGVFSACE